MICVGKHEPRSVLVGRARLLPIYQTAVGDLTIQAAALDYMIVAFAAFLVKHYPISVKRNLCMDIDKKIDFIEEHLTGNVPESANAIQQFIGDLRSSKEEYQNVITSLLEFRAMGIPHRIFFQRKPSRTQVTLGSMKALAERMVNLAFEFSDWQSLSTAVELNKREILRGRQYRLKPLPTPPRTSLKHLDQADKAAL